MPRFVNQQVQQQQLEIVGTEFSAAREVIVAAAKTAPMAREPATPMVTVAAATSVAVGTDVLEPEACDCTVSEPPRFCHAGYTGNLLR
jgi:predicted methyltransferase